VVAECHRLAFPTALTTRLGDRVTLRILSWYLASGKRFLFWVEDSGKCAGYAGGMIADGSQVHGSASGTIQHAFKEILLALLTRPRLWFHPELLSRYRLGLKNIYYRLTAYDVTVKERSTEGTYEPYVGLVVIGVAPAYQGKGYGSLLLNEFEKRTRRLGFTRMRLSVLADNHQAIRAYERNGWTVVSRSGRSVSMEKVLA
jgi:ribosomal protein S18 acetylase RimI-like enzyme